MAYSTNSKTYKASVKNTEFCDAVELFCKQTGRYRAETIRYTSGKMFLSRQWGSLRYIWLEYDRRNQCVYTMVDDRLHRRAEIYHGRPQMDDIAIFSILGELLK